MPTVRYTVVEGRILAENRNGNYRFYRSDALGSTVSLYDSSQNKTDSFTYWPYGETRTSSGSTGTKYKYVGTLGCRTQHDGGIYMRARVMRPKDGRWQTVDPLWPSEPEFAYAGCSPTARADPTGLLDLVIYGKYCGDQSKAVQGHGIDSLDECCKAHDKCFLKHKCTVWNQWFYYDCWWCNTMLGFCASVACSEYIRRWPPDLLGHALCMAARKLIIFYSLLTPPVFEEPPCHD
ncbi:MAG: hypothetical protein HND42_07580 [Armatimonadetes bacterium]|nr:hypothetical protein [Armatimonadota bacterium]NOG93084.1 hypothetical protein [Armatimonadota bacterium]